MSFTERIGGWRKNILGSRHCCMKLKLTPVVPSDELWQLWCHQFGHLTGVKFTEYLIVTMAEYLVWVYIKINEKSCHHSTSLAKEAH